MWMELTLSHLLTSKSYPTAPKPGLVIDGQHRLLGMKDYAPDTDVNVVAILAASDIGESVSILGDQQ